MTSNGRSERAWTEPAAPESGDAPPQDGATVAAAQPKSRPLVPVRLLLWPLVFAVAAAALWVTMHIRADMSLHTVALFMHIMALVVGFGAVLTVDFQAAMWMLGRRRLADVTRFGAATHMLIWIGLSGLVLSGILLHPDLSSTLTRVKLILVLLIALNGLSALGVQARLDQRRGKKPPAGLIIRATAAVLISQVGWWGAATIGFVNSQAASTAAQPAGPPANTGAAGIDPRPAIPPSPPPSPPATERPAAMPPTRAASMGSLDSAMPNTARGSGANTRQAVPCPPNMR